MSGYGYTQQSPGSNRGDAGGNGWVILVFLFLAVVWGGAWLAAFIATQQRLGASLPEALPALFRLPQYAGILASRGWSRPAQDSLVPSSTGLAPALPGSAGLSWL